MALLALGLALTSPAPVPAQNASEAAQTTAPAGSPFAGLQLFDETRSQGNRPAESLGSLFDGFEFPYGSPTAEAAGPTSAAGLSSISGNPGATNIVPGTGALGRFLGFDAESGIRIGGVWLGDTNWLMTGGRQPGEWSFNELALIDLNVDTEKLFGLPGGMFGIQFLQFAGQPTNIQAGLVQGYNSLPGQPPLVRQELYQLWWRQEFFDGKLIVRIGKSAPTFDFDNVARPVPTGDPTAAIPSVSGLLYTPLFVNPTILGKLPGYYNSATGITTTFAPTQSFYLSYGCYDGNLGTGEQIGLRGPQFNGYYFHIWEAGWSWSLGPDNKPGNFGCGFWDQTGKLTAVNLAQVNGAQGVYLFGAQRLWFRNPGQDNSGVSGFLQFGANNSNTMLARQYFGLGLTGFGLVPSRPNDTMGCGLAWAWLNPDPDAGRFFFPGVASSSSALRSNELLLQSYYQAHLRGSTYFEPALSFCPNPGERPGIHADWALTLRLIVLF
jgi:porin